MHLSREATIKCCCQEIEILTHTHTYVHSMDRPSGTWTDEAPSLALAFGMPLAWPCTFACTYVCRCVYVFVCIWQLNLLRCIRMYVAFIVFCILSAGRLFGHARVEVCLQRVALYWAYVFGIRNGVLL